MGKVIVLGLATALAPILITALYLLVRHFHRKWKWQDRVNENSIRQALLDEMDVQWEVDTEGFIRPVKRSARGHASSIH